MNYNKETKMIENINKDDVKKVYDYVTSRYADTRFSTNSYMNTIGDNLLLVTRICKGCYKMIFSDLDTLNKLLVDKDNDYLVDLDLKLPMAISYMNTESTKYEKFMANDSSILNTEDTNIYEAELWGKGIILRNEKLNTDRSKQEHYFNNNQRKLYPYLSEILSQNKQAQRREKEKVKQAKKVRTGQN